MSGWLNIVCSGKFHYLYYAKFLREDDLRSVYFSHRLGTTGDIPANKRRNLFLKEYLTGLHLKIIGEPGIVSGMEQYNKLWELQLNKAFTPAPVNLFLLHGNCLSAMMRAKSHGLVVAEAVNSHPEIVRDRLVAEAQRIGFHLQDLSSSTKRIKQELEISDYLLCPSSDVADSFVRAGFDARRIIVIPYGVEVGESEILGGPTSSLRCESGHAVVRKILCVGQITFRKGQLKLLDLVAAHFDALGQEYPQVTFIGRAEPKYLKLLAGHRVPFLVEPHVSHVELMRRFCEYDLFCLASLEDGFGMVVLEAASNGLPSIVSRFAGVSEIVKDIDGCAVFDPFSTTDFSRAFNRVSGKRVELDMVQYSWKTYAAKLKIELLSLLQGHA